MLSLSFTITFLKNVAESYKYKYNGKEYQDELGLDMYDMPFRDYDPAIGRWTGIDPVTHHSMSPYNAFDGNPVFWADPSGADVIVTNEAFTFTGKDAMNFFKAFSTAIEGEDSHFSFDLEDVIDLTGGLDGNGFKGSGFNINVLQSFPKFATLWSKYPHDINGQHQHPSSDSYAFNQCAIRLGYALIAASVNLASYTDPLTSEGYPRGAKSLADWLWREFGRPTIVSVADFQKNYKDKTGIVFEYANSGSVSHIDIWNKGKTGSGFYNVGYKEIWFWSIK